MFLDGLNEVDRKILELLIGNARLSYSEIGERVGLSRVAVKTRIQGMEEKGIIEMYTAVINPQKISGAVSCYFDIETEPAALEEVQEQLVPAALSAYATQLNVTVDDLTPGGSAGTVP